MENLSDVAIFYVTYFGSLSVICLGYMLFTQKKNLVNILAWVFLNAMILAGGVAITTAEQGFAASFGLK